MSWWTCGRKNIVVLDVVLEVEVAVDLVVNVVETSREKDKPIHVVVKTQPLVFQDELFKLRDKEKLCSNGPVMGAWEHLLPYLKYMRFIPKGKKRKEDIFILSYYPS